LDILENRREAPGICLYVVLEKDEKVSWTDRVRNEVLLESQGGE
jgi:hypothetical protein